MNAAARPTTGTKATPKHCLYCQSTTWQQAETVNPGMENQLVLRWKIVQSLEADPTQGGRGAPRNMTPCGAVVGDPTASGFWATSAFPALGIPRSSVRDPPQHHLLSHLQVDPPSLPRVGMRHAISGAADGDGFLTDLFTKERQQHRNNIS